MLIFSGISGSYCKASLCPNLQCPSSCYGFDGADCTCLPKGCNVEININPDAENKPFCQGGKVKCTLGRPACKEEKERPVCGSSFGFTGKLSGPGCTQRTARSNPYFNHGAAFCVFPDDLLIDTLDCRKRVLCKKNKGRIKPCREDRSLCKCVCAFKVKNQKNTPRCTILDEVKCNKKLTATCSNPLNVPKCDDGKLYCFNTGESSVDLVDKVTCK